MGGPIGNIWRGDAVPLAHRVDDCGFIWGRSHPQERAYWEALAVAMGTDPAELRRRRLAGVIGRTQRRILRAVHAERLAGPVAAWRSRLARLDAALRAVEPAAFRGRRERKGGESAMP